MSEDLLNIEINGKPFKARKGQMIIHVADDADISIPRFCYHKKLSIAANCRMCLVEVEKAPKPLPACATPVMEGMKVFTHSPLALEAQKGVMEFLLINHPLDCPICDQGGECELQDLAMGYGEGVSRFTESKRVVQDKNIGPLVSTDMTRCIHCTRCVRFGEEVAGLRELGATGRGEFMRIGTYVENTMSSEMSGNVIDLCPVGALNAKPSRFSGRSWEMVQHPTIAPHDCVGSNIYMHTLRGQIKRVVPRENEMINETWISDRDRFSYEGILSTERLTSPMIKSSGQWKAVDWDTALQAAVEGINKQVDNAGWQSIGAWAAAFSTLEELYLLQKFMRGLGSNNIDHRLRQIDFSDQANAPVMPWLGQDIQALENQESVLLISSNIRKDQPIAAHKIRKAALNGADVFFVNHRKYDWHFPVNEQLIASPFELVKELAAIVKALSKLTKRKASKNIQEFLSDIDVTNVHKKIAASLQSAERGSVILGSQAVMQPHLSILRILASEIARLSECCFGYLPEAGNTAGAWLAGCVPHRNAAGEECKKPGLTFEEMVNKPLPAYILLNVEPEFDCWNSISAQAAVNEANFVVSLTPFVSNEMKEYADVLLPVGTFSETSGTFVNAEGRWQSFSGVGQVNESIKPAWKVLRVLGNLFNLPDFDYMSTEEIKLELQDKCSNIELNNQISSDASIKLKSSPRGLLRIADMPIYSLDSIVRRASALQETEDAKSATTVLINSETAKNKKLLEIERVNVIQDDRSAVMDLKIDEGIPTNCAWICSGINGNNTLGMSYGTVKLEAV